MREKDHHPASLAADQRGGVLVFWVLAFTGLLGFFAIVADAGLVFLERRELQNAADAAALAGVHEILEGAGHAVDTAEAMAAKNEDALVANEATVLGDGYTVQSSVSKPAASLFGPESVLSLGEPVIHASATARLGTPVWPGPGPSPCAVAASAYFAAAPDTNLTLFCRGNASGVTVPACGVVDISLIADVSYSIVQANAIDDLQNFVHDVVDAFALDAEAGAMIGITAFAERSVSVIEMVADRAALHAAIDSDVTYGPIRGWHRDTGFWHRDRRAGYRWGHTGMYTDLLAGLQGGADQYTNGVTDRAFAPNVVIYVTDAEDTEGHDVSDIVALRDLILTAGGANSAAAIIAVGVGDQNDDVLEAIATDNHVYSTRSWGGLAALLADVARDACSFSAPPPNPTSAAAVVLGGMTPANQDFEDAALYGGPGPLTTSATAASPENYAAWIEGLRLRLQYARVQGCYTWAQVQNAAACGPLHVAQQRADDIQATAIVLLPLAIDDHDPDLTGDSIELYTDHDDKFVFAYFWIDGDATFDPITGQCESRDDATCAIRGRFVTGIPPVVRSGADFGGIEIQAFDDSAPVAVVQLID